jgi:hypothetical protein
MPDDKKRPMKGPQLRFTMTRAPGQPWILRPWSPHIPTMYFLDINAMDVIKKSANNRPLDARKVALLARLRDIDRPGNRVSCLLALMEKVNDRRDALSDPQLRAEIENDVALTRRFFVDAKPGDPDTFHLDYFDGVRGLLVEQNEPSYLTFLKEVNDRHRLASTVSPRKRFDKTKEVVSTADALGIVRVHPLVVLCLACIYGNRDARKVMKFKADPQNYEVENVLADVMTIGRFLGHQIELEELGARGKSSVQRVEYITDDAGLAAVLRCYRGTSISYADLGTRQQIRTTGRMEFADLLTEISHAGGPLADPADPASAGSSEYVHVRNLLLAAPPLSTAQP